MPTVFLLFLICFPAFAGEKRLVAAERTFDAGSKQYRAELSIGMLRQHGTAKLIGSRMFPAGSWVREIFVKIKVVKGSRMPLKYERMFCVMQLADGSEDPTLEKLPDDPPAIRRYAGIAPHDGAFGFTLTVDPRDYEKVKGARAKSLLRIYFAPEMDAVPVQVFLAYVEQGEGEIHISMLP